MSDLVTILAAPFAACLVVAGIHAYLGLHVLAREIIFVDLALAQVAALGASFAFLIGYELESPPAYLFALGATLFGAALFASTRSRHERVPQEAIIGIVYAVSAAAGIIVMDRAPHGGEHLKSLLVGSILWVTWPTVLKTAAIYAVIGGLHWWLRKRFLAISFDEGEARRRGWSIRFWDFLFYALFGVVVTIGVQIAGVLLVFCFLIVPAVCGTLLSSTLSGRLIIGWIVGFLVSAIGCILSYVTDAPTGATVACTFGAALIVISLARLVSGRAPSSP